MLNFVFYACLDVLVPLDFNSSNFDSAPHRSIWARAQRKGIIPRAPPILTASGPAGVRTPPGSNIFVIPPSAESAEGTPRGSNRCGHDAGTLISGRPSCNAAVGGLGACGPLDMRVSGPWEALRVQDGRWSRADMRHPKVRPPGIEPGTI